MSDRRIGDFEIRKVLGEGAMGKVYLGHDVHLDRPVALKVLGERTLGDPSFFDRFRREAKLAASLNHPHIATIYAFGEHEGEPYIAMEFVEGETLSDLIRRGPLSLEDVRKFGRQAALALAVAHDRGIVHRDIKPANLMVTAGGDLKVMDFGVARRTGDTQLTQAGSLVGTANIMAPETIRGGESGPASDLFSLGCVLYEALTGVPAFTGEDAMAVLYQVMNVEPDPVETRREDVPAGLRNLVHGLLVKDPEARFGPASAVADALDGNGGPGPAPDATLAAGDLGTTLLTPPAPGPRSTVALEAAPTPPGFLRRYRWGLAVAGAALVVGAIWFGGWGDGGGGSGPVDPKLDAAARARRTQAGLLNDQGIEILKMLEADPNRPDRDSLAVAARGFFQDATEQDGTFATAWVNLGEIWRRDGNLKAARSTYASAVDLNPDHAPSHLNYASVLESLDETDLAEEHYQRAVDLEDSLVQITAMNEFGVFLTKQGKAEKAVGILEPAAREFPHIPHLWKNLGLARLALSDLDGADSALDRAMAEASKYPRDQVEDVLAALTAGRARVAEARGNTALALTLWTEAATSPDTTQAAAARDALARLRSVD